MRWNQGSAAVGRQLPGPGEDVAANLSGPERRALHYIHTRESSGFLKAFGLLRSREFAELGRWELGLAAAIGALYCRVSGGQVGQVARLVIRSRLPSGSRSSNSHP